jgi:tetratricopeptide (TPR) repeat protein
MAPAVPVVSNELRIRELLSFADSALHEEFPPNVDAAFQAYQQALELDETNVETLDALGELLANVGDTDRAIKVLLLSAELSPDSGPGKYFYLGQMLNGKDALEAFRKCVSLMHENDEDKARKVSVLCAIGELFMTDLADEDEAEVCCQEAFERAVQTDSTSVEALNGIATFHRIRLEIEDSKRYCNLAFEQISNFFDSENLDEIAPYTIRQRLATNMVELAMVEEALAVLASLLEEDEEDIQSWFLTGCCHLVAKQKEDALECVKECKKLIKIHAKKNMEPSLVIHWTNTVQDLNSRIVSL